MSARCAIPLMALTVLLIGCSVTTAGSANRADLSLAEITETLGLPASDAALTSGAVETSASTGPRATGEVQVLGSFGQDPQLSFPETEPPLGLTLTVLGEGPKNALGHEVVAAGDTVVVDYQAHVWGSELPFDSSFDSRPPFGFVIGSSQVLPGWDQGLVGAPNGTRVLLTIPPDLGYGPEGNANAGIGGDDVIVFVLDILAALPKDQFGSPADDSVATPASLPAGISVRGAPGEAPSLSITSGTPEPSEPGISVLNYGSGEPLVDGSVYLQVASSSWDGSQQSATWQEEGPSLVEVFASDPGLALLVGLPVGSRVLLVFPSDPAADSAALAVVLDILFQVA